MANATSTPIRSRETLQTLQPMRLLQPLRAWLSTRSVEDPKRARRLAQLIPAQCPFARDITLFGHLIAQIPPLCQINPFYEELMALRFRALCYLADECGEDVSAFI
ncbi:MAG: Mo-dependent nitrogenase C-terminal domain-containing protein [Leptolyngbyaceae cyanobacterium]